MGTFSIPLAKAYTHLKITNQDLETVMPLARDVRILTTIGVSLAYQDGGMGKGSIQSSSRRAD